MSTEPTGTEVFAEIDADPDAVLAEFGVESPEDLLEADSGAHDPVPDEGVDVDDTTAAELFAELEAVETADGPASGAESGAASDADRPVAEAVEDDLEFEFVGDSDVVVRDDGDVIDSTAAELSAVTATESSGDEPFGFHGDRAAESTESPALGDDTGRDRARDDRRGTLTVRAGAADDLELVGPEPTPNRVANETFGVDAADAR